MKKFLALVLALVMTMSLVTISAGAEDFTDDSKITYEEAVDVMTAVGVVSGYENGSFNPTGTLTRGAAAKIICNMILGPTTAEALSANDAPYSDVPVDHVFAGYIAYCANEGIISGYADGTFKPAATLTGYAFMKMLLGALGYDATNEGYVGSNWSIQVAKRALNIGLDNGLEGQFVGAKALTREEACLYAFNTLKATMVDYENDSKITVGDIVISNSSKAEEIPQGAKYENLYGCSNKTLEFAEKYFEDLSGSKKVDAYGRPAVEWKVDKDVVGTFASEADYVVVLDETYDNMVALVKDVLDETDDDLNADKAIANGGVWFNGANLDDRAAVDSKLSKEAHAGTVIELFVDDEDDVTVTDIVAYGYEIAKIDTVSSKVSAAAAKKGATTSIKLLNAEGTSIGTYYDEFEDAPAKVLAGFDADTYTEDTMIAIVKNDTTIIDSCVVDSVDGQITSFKKDVHAYVDGTKYLMAGGVACDAIDFDEEYSLYLDPNGFVLLVDGDLGATIDDVYYVTGVYADTDSKGNTVYYAETVSLVGEVADLVIAQATYEALDTDGKGFDAVGALYTLTLNADDEYVQSAVSADYDVYDTTKMTADVKADAASATIGSKVYFDDATQFVSVKTTAAGAVKEIKAAEGGMSYAGANEAKAFAITKDGERDALYVLYVGAKMSSTVVTDDVVFVDAVSTEQDSKETFLTSVIYMDGNIEDELTVKTAAGKAVGFYTYALNADNQYELTAVTDKLAGDVADSEATGWSKIGFVKGGIHNSTVTYETKSVQFVDVDFAAATVIDLRTEDVIEADQYDREILSASDVIDAADANQVVAYVYAIDGEITFIAVEAVN